MRPRGEILNFCFGVCHFRSARFLKMSPWDFENESTKLHMRLYEFMKWIFSSIKNLRCVFLTIFFMNSVQNKSLTGCCFSEFMSLFNPDFSNWHWIKHGERRTIKRHSQTSTYHLKRHGGAEFSFEQVVRGIRAPTPRLSISGDRSPSNKSKHHDLNLFVQRRDMISEESALL